MIEAPKAQDQANEGHVRGGSKGNVGTVEIDVLFLDSLLLGPV